MLTRKEKLDLIIDHNESQKWFIEFAAIYKAVREDRNKRAELLADHVRRFGLPDAPSEQARRLKMYREEIMEQEAV